MLKQVKELDDILAVKLGDPVEANGAGEVFDAEKRLQYLNIAYSKLKRILHLVARGYKPEFASQKSIVTIEHTIDSPRQPGQTENLDLRGQSEFELSSFTGLPNEVVLTFTHKNKIASAEASYMPPNKYLSFRNGINTLKAASFDDQIFYYTILDGKLYLLPKATQASYYRKIEALLTKDAEFFNLTDKVFITNDYIDLLIDLAAIQGMQDTARTDKVQLYRAEVYDQIKLIAGFSQMEKQEEGVLTND